MAKVKLNHIKGNSYFCSGIFSIGVYVQGNNVILIDSGSDKQSTKNTLLALEDAKYTVNAIINTHCHPDHCGGNYFFQQKFPNIKIYATHDEKEFIENPEMAPRCFWQGAAPCIGLQNKHIAPQKYSTVTNVIKPYKDQVITNGEEFKIITLPGHTSGSIGIITPDNVLYSGDAIFGEDTFQKHPVLLYTNIGKSLETFNKLASINVHACVFYHGGLLPNDLKSSTQQHKQRIEEIQLKILNYIAKQSRSVDTITQYIMQTYNIPDNIVAFTLTQTTMRAFLTELERQKKIELMVKNGLLQAISK